MRTCKCGGKMVRRKCHYPGFKRLKCPRCGDEVYVNKRPYQTGGCVLEFRRIA